MLRWFLALPVRRKILLFLAGGMLTLVFDAFVAHFSWKAFTMKWTQALPVFYGLLAFVVLGVAAVLPISEKLADRLVKAVGAIGMGIGLTGMVLHFLSLKESLEGETLSIVVIGKALKLAPPIFAPAAFAGVGLLLLTLSRITHGAERAIAAHHSHLEHPGADRNVSAGGR